jgi:hypothetical protein
VRVDSQFCYLLEFAEIGEGRGEYYNKNCKNFMFNGHVHFHFKMWRCDLLLYFIILSLSLLTVKMDMTIENKVLTIFAGAFMHTYGLCCSYCWTCVTKTEMQRTFVVLWRRLLRVG